MTETGAAAPRSAAAWNMVFGYATLACVITRNVLLVPLYLRYIGLDEYGAWLATGGALVQLLMSDYGVGGVVLQRVAAAFGANERDRLAGILGAALASALVLTAGLSLLALVLAPWLPDLLGLGAASAPRVSQCFLIAIAANGIGVFITIAGSVARGLQRAIVPGAVLLAAELLLIAVTVVLLYQGFGLYALAIGMLVRAAAGALGLSAYLVRITRREFRIAPRFSQAESLRLVADSANVFTVALSMRVLARSDVFLVGVVLGAGAAAAYGLTIRLVEVAVTLLGQATGALAAGLAHLHGRGEVVRFHGLLDRLVPILSTLTLVVLGTAAVITPDFVALWVGPDKYAGPWPVAVYAVAAWLAALGYCGYDALMARAEFRFVARVFVVGALIQAALAAGLLPLGSAGAPLAAAIAALGWGGVFWWRIAAVAPAEVGRHAQARRSVLAAAVAIAVIATPAALLLPAATGWLALAAKALGVGLTLAAAAAASSGWLRQVVREEALATLGALRRAA